MSKKAVQEFLRNDTNINAKVEDHFYSGHIPQGVKEEVCVVLNVITKTPVDYSLDNEVGISSMVLQIDVYGRGQRAGLDVEEVAELIRLRLSGYRGQLNDDVFCHGAFIDTEREVETEPPDASDQWPQRQSVDYRLYLTTPIPTH